MGFHFILYVLDWAFIADSWTSVRIRLVCLNKIEQAYLFVANILILNALFMYMDVMLGFILSFFYVRMYAS